jgi:carboxymethylenebutenolidase
VARAPSPAKLEYQNTMTCTRSQLSLESGGKAVAVDCFLPSAQSALLPAVIGLHGSGGGLETLGVMAQNLAAEGFAVYLPHYFQRTGTISTDEATIFRNFPIWGKALWDVNSFVAQQPAVDLERIGLLGRSLGGYLALSLAAVDTRVKAVVEYFGGLPKEVRFFQRHMPPTLILHGDADTVVPVAEAYSVQKVLEERNVPYEIKIYPGEGHIFNLAAHEDAERRAAAFLKKYLRG